MEIDMTTRTLRSPWFLYLATLLLASSAFAQAGPDDSSPPIVDDAALENAFWACDVAATRDALPLSAGAQCAIVSDALKERRFEGDFERLLAWWRDNKAREHAARDEGAADPLRAP
jgi:hypothetical protein